MSDKSLFSFESNQLEQLLMPSWAREKDASSPGSDKKKEEKFFQQDTEQPNKRFSKERNFNKAGRFNGPRKNNDRKAAAASSQRDERFPERRNYIPAPPMFTGWSVDFIPNLRVVDGIAKQVKTEARAYPLFELTRLILEKPDRYELLFTRLASVEKKASPLFQYVGDGGLWLSEKEALAHVLKKERDQFYRCEKITTEPPKGNYTCVGVCGMSQKLLGPPNHHEYQTKIRELHAEQFSHLPLEVYKSRIQLLRDEETLQRWKEEQSSQDHYFPIATKEGEDALVLKTLLEVEEHFKKHHAVTQLVEVGEKIKLSGQAAMSFSASPIHFFVKNAIEEMRRFPLRLSQFLAEDLMDRGLQVFKAHENITYVSVARPRCLDRATTPVAENLSAMLAYLEAHPKAPRAEQWRGLVELRVLSEEMSEAEREASVAKDLSWLIHQGYVVNYALRGLQVVSPQKSR